MSRYIDADALYKELCEEMGFDEAERFNDYYLGEIPTADVVEVVRCRDCKYWDNRFDVMVCNLTDGMKGAGDYCSYGERREDDKG